MDNDKYVEVLLEAKALISNGWCQGRDKVVGERFVGVPATTLEPEDPTALMLMMTERVEEYCLRGAVCEAAVRCGLTELERRTAWHTTEYTWLARTGVSAVTWNDEPYRTKPQVEHALDQLIRYEKDKG